NKPGARVCSLAIHARSSFDDRKLRARGIAGEGDLAMCGPVQIRLSTIRHRHERGNRPSRNNRQPGPFESERYPCRSPRMPGKTPVSVVVGSLRKESFSRKVARALIAQAPASLECRVVEIGDLPMYNQDLDESPPEQWTRFRDAIRSSRAVLFVTPEYNRSIPGCLKNAIDVASQI